MHTSAFNFIYFPYSETSPTCSSLIYSAVYKPGSAFWPLAALHHRWKLLITSQVSHLIEYSLLSSIRYVSKNVHKATTCTSTMVLQMMKTYVCPQLTTADLCKTWWQMMSVPPITWNLSLVNPLIDQAVMWPAHEGILFIQYWRDVSLRPLHLSSLVVGI